MRFKRIGVIYNPKAGKNNDEYLFEKEIEPIILKYKGDSEIISSKTEYKRHGEILAKELIEKECEIIIALGGDGTINEIVNGIMNTDKGNEKCHLGIIPIGTGNDWVRNFKIYERKLEEIIEKILLQPKIITVDIGHVSCRSFSNDSDLINRWFLNESSMGYSAKVIETINNSERIINKTITFSFYSLYQQFFYKNPSISYQLDKNITSVISQMVVISNGKFFGSGMMINPSADISDGFLDVLIVKDSGLFDAITVLPRIYQGTHLNHHKVSHFTSPSLSISSDEHVLVESDGEVIGLLPASWSCHPNKLKLVIPS